MGEYGFSQAVRRREDERLLTGQGRFLEDETVAGALSGAVLRAPFAHARIRRLEVAPARSLPGVRAVLTADDLEALGCSSIACGGDFPVKCDTPIAKHHQPVLAREIVRFPGEAVAFVVAESELQAQDALEAVEVDYEALPAASDLAAAAAQEAPQLWPDCPGNRAFLWELGSAEATAAAFARAASVVSLAVVNNRVVQSPLETRNALGLWDGARFCLRTGTQMPNAMQRDLARLLRVPVSALRVLVADVGGSFGGKNSLYPEQLLVLAAARLTGRPVRWVASRSEAFLADFQGRDNLTQGRLALDEAGRILALEVETRANLGAYLASRGAVSPTAGTVMLSNTYRIPALHVRVEGIYSNSVPTDPYRGAGRPEAIYLVERLLDRAARELGRDRLDLRRRNLIAAEEFPYRSPTGMVYDACDFAAVLEAALKRSDWAGFPARKSESEARGRLRGIGISNYVERCGGGAGMGETARLAFDAEGVVTLTIGSMTNGQGHETAFSQIVNEALGLPFERIRILQGDTDRVASGNGTGGSWSITLGSGASLAAAGRLLEKARRLAAHFLEASEGDLTFAAGRFAVAGTDLAIDLCEVARRAFVPEALPPGEAPGLEGEARFVPEHYTFPHGCHVAEVEIDPETGALQLVAYRAVHDFGRVLNPLLLAGQVHGGLAQGIGQALTERVAYDESGQLLTASFLDYGLPRADDLPSFDFLAVETPSPRNPLGIKGCGEAGATGAPPAVMNAILDALAPLGVQDLDMPATPERIWRAIRKAQGPA